MAFFFPLAKDSTLDLYEKYVEQFDHLPTLDLNSNITEEEFIEMMKKAMETGIPINKNDKELFPPQLHGENGIWSD